MMLAEMPDADYTRPQGCHRVTILRSGEVV
jgi:hypothetical protein